MAKSNPSPSAAKPSKPPTSKSNPGWLIGLLVLALVIVVLVIGYMIFNNQPDETGAEVQVTPVEASSEPAAPAVGGMVVPTETPVGEGVDSENQTSAGEPIDAGALRPGLSVITVGPAVRLYAEPSSNAQVFDSLGEGTTIMVLEPSGDFDAYPVEASGQLWVRVRTADGLVAWVAVEQLAVAE